jgi:L-lactate dehydrogenase complex protein LldG
MELTMSENSRERIFARLKSAVGSGAEHVPETACLPIETFSQRERIEKLKTLMEAMRTEVHLAGAQNWIDKLIEILTRRKVKQLLYGPGTKISASLEHHWEATVDGLPQLIAYTKDIEQFKERIFNVDAGITSTAGAIAETGALILWASGNEPRLMSLVPPIHIAVVEAKNIYNTFCEVIQKQNWADKMPTNAILISGPSKTADIELTLAFGVHGPKELIVILLED